MNKELIIELAKERIDKSVSRIKEINKELIELRKEKRKLILIFKNNAKYN